MLRVSIRTGHRPDTRGVSFAGPRLTTNLIAVNMDQDYDAIRAEEIQRGDNIEFPSNHPDVKWHVEEGRASKPPCNQPVGRSSQIHRERGRGGSRSRRPNQGPCARPPLPAKPRMKPSDNPCDALIASLYAQGLSIRATLVE
jgi:hypothetical protein